MLPVSANRCQLAIHHTATVIPTKDNSEYHNTQSRCTRPARRSTAGGATTTKSDRTARSVASRPHSSPPRIVGSPAMRSTNRRSSNLPTQDFANQKLARLSESPRVSGGQLVQVRPPPRQLDWRDHGAQKRGVRHISIASQSWKDSKATQRCEPAQSKRRFNVSVIRRPLVR